jgi:hypothetical protein
MSPPPPQGPKPADRLAKGEAPGTKYDYEEKIDFAVFPSLQVRPRPEGGCGLSVPFGGGWQAAMLLWWRGLECSSCLASQRFNGSTTPYPRS